MESETGFWAVTKGFWAPVPKDFYTRYLGYAIPKTSTLTSRNTYLSNVAYTLQYAEFNASMLEGVPDGRLHNVIAQQVRKTFIIAGCSVVEAILWATLKQNDLQKKTEWEEMHCVTTNTFRATSGEQKYEITAFRKAAAATDVEMKFRDLCTRAEDKKVLGANVGSHVYQKINHLRKLRNKVHIRDIQHDKDSDWYSFKKDDVETMKDVLAAVFQSDVFQPHTDFSTFFYWLLPPATK